MVSLAINVAAFLFLAAVGISILRALVILFGFVISELDEIKKKKSPKRKKAIAQEIREAWNRSTRKQKKDFYLALGLPFLFLIFTLLFCMVGCGGSDTPHIPLTATTSYNSIDFNALSALSPMPGHDCSNIGPRASTSLNGVDLWKFNSNCTIESFSCGNVGYIISDDWAQTQNPRYIGTLEFQITDRYKSPDIDTYCFAIGRHRCQYEMEPFGRVGEFTWTCQLNPQ